MTCVAWPELSLTFNVSLAITKLFIPHPRPTRYVGRAIVLTNLPGTLTNFKFILEDEKENPPPVSFNGFSSEEVMDALFKNWKGMGCSMVLYLMHSFLLYSHLNYFIMLFFFLYYYYYYYYYFILSVWGMGRAYCRWKALLREKPGLANRHRPSEQQTHHGTPTS